MKKDKVQISAEAVDEAFRAMLDIRSILSAAIYHEHDIKWIKSEIRKLGGLKAFDQKTGVLFEHLPKEYQARLMER